MSMLSAQADELRTLEINLREIARGGVEYLAYHEINELVSAADAIREAADTIESLRDRLLLGDPYEAVACEHVITPDELHRLLDEWDTHPGRAATDEEMMRYEHCRQTGWRELHVRSKAIEELSLRIIDENTDLRIENIRLKREIERLRGDTE